MRSIDTTDRADPETEAMMTRNAETPAERGGTLRTCIMNEFRRASDGLDPDDVYAYIVRLQARIDFLEGHVREVSNAAILDATLRQAAEIRRQALEAAERAWTEIIQAAQEEAARRRDEAARDAQRLLEEACAEIRIIHDRLRAPAPTETPAPGLHPHGRDSGGHRTASGHQERPLGANGVLTTRQDRSIDATRTDGADADPPFRLPAWIEE
jgi:hypothetical protein